MTYSSVTGAQIRDQKAEVMGSYSRYAVYYMPQGDALAAFGASWLGWNVECGAPRDDVRYAPYSGWTQTPRKYGFHGTLKPPIRLAKGKSEAELSAALHTLTTELAPGVCDGLELARLGRFLALVPKGDQSSLARVAGHLVTELDAFRAPASDAELTRRRSAGLTPTQDALLLKWGYPYVLEEFRFHLTLTGKLGTDDIGAAHDLLQGVLPPLPAPFIIDAVALAGERADGHFELIRSYPLRG